MTSTPSTKRAPAWVHRAMVTCVGGPCHGFWFFVEDWQQRVQSAQFEADLGHRPGRPPCDALGYTLTDEYTPHPTYPDHAVGRVLRWQEVSS